MQRDLVERARTGDHDAFAELAGAAISRLDGDRLAHPPGRGQAKDAVQNALVRAWRDLPTLRDPGSLRRLAASAPGPMPASMRRAGSDAIASTSSSPTLSIPPSTDDAASVDRRPRPARTRLPPARSGDAGRRSSSITTSTCRSRTVAATLGIPLGHRQSRVSTAALGLMRAALDADRAIRARASVGGPSGMTHQRRRSDRTVSDMAPRGGRASRARTISARSCVQTERTRQRPCVVEPRKVASRGHRRRHARLDPRLPALAWLAWSLARRLVIAIGAGACVCARTRIRLPAPFGPARRRGRRHAAPTATSLGRSGDGRDGRRVLAHRRGTSTSAWPSRRDGTRFMFGAGRRSRPTSTRACQLARRRCGMGSGVTRSPDDRPCSASTSGLVADGSRDRVPVVTEPDGARRDRRRQRRRRPASIDARRRSTRASTSSWLRPTAS